MKITYSKELIKFLKSWECLEAFNDNVKNSGRVESDNIESLWSGFLWSETQEGFEFWNNLQEMFDSTL